MKKQITLHADEKTAEKFKQLAMHYNITQTELFERLTNITYKQVTEKGKKTNGK